MQAFFHLKVGYPRYSTGTNQNLPKRYFEKRIDRPLVFRYNRIG